MGKITLDVNGTVTGITSPTIGQDLTWMEVLHHVVNLLRAQGYIINDSHEDVTLEDLQNYIPEYSYLYSTNKEEGA